MSRSGRPSLAPLEKPVLLCAEGRSCQIFLEALVGHLALQDLVEVRDFGGITQLRPFLTGIVVDSGFPNVNKIGVVRDAETNAAGALASVSAAFQAAGLTAVWAHAIVTPGAPSTGAFILPDGINPGNLETLCLSAVSHPQRMPCVDAFLHCLDANGIPVHSREKSRAYAYIAASRKPDVPLGRAAWQGEFDLAHISLDALRQFVVLLAT